MTFSDFIGYWNNTRTVVIYTAEQINSNPGIINELSLWVVLNIDAVYGPSSPMHDISILLKNVSTTTTNPGDVIPPSFNSFGDANVAAWEANGFTTVLTNYTMDDFVDIEQWYTYTFDNSFEYTGGNIAVVMMADQQPDDAYGELNFMGWSTYPTPAGTSEYIRSASDDILSATMYWADNAYNLNARLNVEGFGVNELRGIYPEHNSTYYAGITMPVAQNPGIIYFKEKSFGSPGQYSYTITRLSDNVVVYRAKSGMGAGDTLILLGPDFGTEITSRVPMAEGMYAGSNGIFNMSSPEAGEYRVDVRYYLNNEFVNNLISTFEILLPQAEYRGVVPADGTQLLVGRPLTVSQYPGILTYRALSVAPPPIITYLIKNPSGVVIYQATDSLGSPEITIGGSNVGAVYLYNFKYTTGSATYPNGSANAGLINTNVLPAGTYTVEVTFDNQLSPMSYITEHFYVTYEYDTELEAVLVPHTSPVPSASYLYSVSKGYELPLEYQMRNNGIHPIYSLEFTAEIIGPTSKTFIDTFTTTTNPLNPLTVRQIVTTNKLITSDMAVGNYMITASIRALNPGNTDAILTNDGWPKSGEPMYFRITEPYNLPKPALVTPEATSYRYPSTPTFSITNLGTEDINGSAASLVVTRILGADTMIVYTDNSYLDNVTSTPSNFRFNKLFVPTEVGAYYFVFTIMQANGEELVYTYTVNVQPGLVGTMTIGQGGTYSTFNAAVADLFRKGVGGNVVFKLIDNQYIFDGVTQLAPDFRSRIEGAGPNATITFQPSDILMGEQTPIQFRITNQDGYGIVFGQAYTTTNDSAAVNVVTDPVYKKYYGNSNGYITFDGGVRKNIQIILQGAKSYRGKGFAVPFYLDAGSHNITIKNCRMDGVSEPTAGYAADIPLVTYNSNTEEFTYADNLSDDGLTSKAISSGVFIRNFPLPAARINNIMYSLDKMNANNNTVQGNIISGFGYGIVSLGMGGMVENGTTIVPMYNKNNTFDNNYISNVYCAGIFLGFEENAKVSHNRISGVVGGLTAQLPTAGIMLGREVRDVNLMDGLDLSYNNLNAVIERNEIDNVASDVTSSGIYIVEPSVSLTLNSVVFPIPAEVGTYKLTNNLIYGITYKTRTQPSNRYGISITPCELSDVRREVNASLFNNTILMDDIAGTSTGIVTTQNAIAAIRLFDLTKYDVVNNATYLRIDNTVNYDYAAGFAIKGQNPQVGKVNIDYNSFYLDRIRTSYGTYATSAIQTYVRFFELDNRGRLVDNGGFASEYNTLRNWINWTRMDKHSVVYNFNADLASRRYNFTTDLAGRYNILRMNDTTIANTVSLLDRGLLLTDVTVDIDNKSRAILGKGYNIGAIDFTSKRYLRDIEIRNITAPAAYMNNSSTNKFNDAEYIMLHKKEAVVVKALVRNNGQNYISDVPITCSITGGNAIIPQTQKVSLAVGEEQELLFFTDSTFRPTPYEQLGTSNPPIPEFSNMMTTVTPVYTIRVDVDAAFTTNRDEYPANNTYTSKARFFVPQAKLNLLVSAENSHVSLYDGKNPNRTEQDIVAGKLNYDTLVKALNNLGFTLIGSETDPLGSYTFDVLERTGWESRNINYSVYNAVIWSDGHDKSLSYWEKESLINYANSGTPTHKTSLILASQEILRENNDLTDKLNKELQDNVLRANHPTNYTTTPIQIKGLNHNIGYVIDVAETGYVGVDTMTTLVDAFPEPSQFRMIDTNYGKNFIAYYFLNNNTINMKPNNTLGLEKWVSCVASKMIDRNVVFTAIDWRHLKNATAFLSGIFNDIGDEFNYDEPTLAVVLSAFDATPIGKKVALNWATASEYNTSNFEVQRANVSNNIIGLFDVVGTQQANGFTTSESNYDLFDTDVNYGYKYAYRLKINDFNGNYKYSDTKLVSINYSANAIFGEASPNPASDRTNVEYSVSKDAMVLITLNDITGNTLMTLHNGNISAGVHNISIDVSKLPSGTYNVMFIIDGKLIEKSTMFTVAR
jgi:hypothetical protein